MVEYQAQCIQKLAEGRALLLWVHIMNQGRNLIAGTFVFKQNKQRRLIKSGVQD